MDIDQIAAEIERLLDRVKELQAERNRLTREARNAELDAKLVKLPAEVLELFQHENPRAEDMRRLSPRKLAYTQESGGRWRTTSRHWTREGEDLRTRLRWQQAQK